MGTGAAERAASIVTTCAYVCIPSAIRMMTMTRAKSSPCFEPAVSAGSCVLASLVAPHGPLPWRFTLGRLPASTHEHGRMRAGLTYCSPCHLDFHDVALLKVTFSRHLPSSFLSWWCRSFFTEDVRTPSRPCFAFWAVPSSVVVLCQSLWGQLVNQSTGCIFLRSRSLCCSQWKAAVASRPAAHAATLHFTCG